jgi:hypothetical protein
LFHGTPTIRACNTPLTDTSGRAPRDSGFNDIDFGMSPAVDVRDFVSNTAAIVKSIATNFNGLTNVARAGVPGTTGADSIYYLDEGLRLHGTSPEPGIGLFGMDMNYNHNFTPSGACAPTCGGTGSPNDRILFTARNDANIDVWDTFHGAVIGSIPIRDPIIGPLRVAKDALGNQLLFGVTPRGVVTVVLPAFTNPLPAPKRAVRVR